MNRLLQSILNRTEISFRFLRVNFSMRGFVLILRSVSNDLSISLSVINELMDSLGCSLLITFDKSFRSSYTCSSNIDEILFFDQQLRTSLCFRNPKPILIRKFCWFCSLSKTILFAVPYIRTPYWYCGWTYCLKIFRSNFLCRYFFVWYEIEMYWLHFIWT